MEFGEQHESGLDLYCYEQWLLSRSTARRAGLDAAVVANAATTNGAKIIQWSFGSSGDDQWKPTQNSDGSYTFFNLKSGLVLSDPGSSTNTSTQMDQETSTGGNNQKWNLLKQ